MLQLSKAFVVSDEGKGSLKSQVTLVETTAREPLKKCRNRKIDVKTRGRWLLWDKLRMHLFTALTTSGTKMA